VSDAGGGVRHEWPLTDTLSLSCQRHPLPDSGVARSVPRSWGALPLLDVGPRQLLVPVPDGEGLWLGLVRETGAPTWPVRVLAVLAGGGPVVDALTGRAEVPGGEGLLVPPAHAVLGISRGDGTWWPFTRAAPHAGALSCARLDVMTGSPGPVLGPPAGSTGPLRQHDHPATTRGPAPPAATRRRPARWSPPVRLELVDPAAFRAAGGGPVPPLDPDAPYRGQRLP
jgi:hypothetical protein